MTTQFRVYIGPVYLAAGTPEHFDWSALNAGAASTLTTATTLAATLSDGATSMTIASATGWGTSGGFWVAPNGTGQGWEYIRFSARSGTTVSGLVREAANDRDHNGLHSSGAAVQLWWSVQSDDGSLHFVEEMNDNLCASSWHMELSGISIPKSALKNKHTCVIQTRENFAGSWTNFAVGFIDSPSVRDDAQRSSTWKVRVQSVAWLLGKTWLTGVRVGDLDLAKHAVEASSSQTLVDVYSERSSGDFVAADPSFEAANVTNDDAGVLWIGERFHGTPNTPAPNSDPTSGMAFKLKFTHIYINPPAGSRPGTRYIELTAVGGLTATGIDLFSASGGGSMVQWAFNGPGAMAAGDKIILCEDEAVFQDEHPLASYGYVKVDAGFWAHLLASGGMFGLRLGSLDQWWTIAKWGHGNGGLSAADAASPPTWSGTTITVPAYGQTMRYLHAPSGTPTQSVDFWQTSLTQTAGYDIATSPADWLMLTLPPLGLEVRDDMTSGFTGTLPLVDGADLSVTGLPSSGTLQVGSEQMSYSSKSRAGVVVSARGTGGTAAAAHKAGDKIWLIDGGVATEAHLFKSIAWKRSGGTIYPKQYRIKVSKLTEPRNPDAAGYGADWTEVYSTSSNAAASYTHALSPSQRVRVVLIQFETMTTDPARARLNEVIAEVDASVWESGTALDEGTLAGAVAQQLATNAGLPAGAFSTVGGTLAMQGFTTAAENAWSVLGDFADFARLRLLVQRDSKVRIELDPFWTASSFTPVRTWARVNASAMERVFGVNENVSQVEIHWRTADESSSGVVRYPSPAWIDGKVAVINDAIFVDGTAAQAAASRLFFMRRFPYTLLVEMAGGDPSIRAGEIHALTWQFDAAQPASTRTFFVQSVDHTIERMEWATVLNLIEIDRTSAA